MQIAPTACVGLCMIRSTVTNAISLSEARALLESHRGWVEVQHIKMWIHLRGLHLGLTAVPLEACRLSLVWEVNVFSEGGRLVGHSSNFQQKIKNVDGKLERALAKAYVAASVSQPSHCLLVCCCHSLWFSFIFTGVRNCSWQASCFLCSEKYFLLLTWLIIWEIFYIIILF